MMNDYNYADSYFKGELSAGEMEQFDQRVRQDPAFAEEVSFYCSTMQLLRDEAATDKKTRFRELYKQQANIETGRVVPITRWWPKLAAAAVILFAIAGAYLYFTPASPTTLADTYITQELKEMPVEMDNRQDSITTGIRLYNEKKLAASLQVFESIMNADASSTDAKKYAGIVSLQLGEYDKALKYFTELENYPGLQVNYGKFYHAITLLKRNQPGDMPMAKQLLVEVDQQNLAGKKRASEWLKHF